MAVAASRSTTSEGISERVLRVVIGGGIAGGVFIAVTMWFASSLGDPANGPLMMISTIIQGEGAMKAGTANPTIGLVVHAVLSILFALVFSLFVSRLKTNGTVALAGIVYGALLYIVNFLIIAPIAFPIFEMANQPFELAIHIVFGALLAPAFFSSGVRGNEPAVAVGGTGE
jgi:hypothetical protein